MECAFRVGDHGLESRTPVSVDRESAPRCAQLVAVEHFRVKAEAMHIDMRRIRERKLACGANRTKEHLYVRPFSRTGFMPERRSPYQR